jgi:hypothetical protein
LNGFIFAIFDEKVLVVSKKDVSLYPILPPFIGKDKGNPSIVEGFF